VAEATVSFCDTAFGIHLDEHSLTLQPTRKDFEGDITLVVFSLTKAIRKSPAETAQLIGEALLLNVKEIERYNVIQGFLNITFTSSYWIDSLSEFRSQPLADARTNMDSAPILVEFSSPNTIAATDRTPQSANTFFIKSPK